MATLPDTNDEMSMNISIPADNIARKGLVPPPPPTCPASEEFRLPEDPLTTASGNSRRTAGTTDSTGSAENWQDEGERSLRILLVEDDEVNQLVTAEMLQSQGHTVLVADDGKAALEALETEQPPSFDLMLMDLLMPRMNGIEATAAIRRRERDSNTHIPIIAMTGCATDRDRERCIDAGMDDYVAKPIQDEAFLDLIARAACGRSATAGASVGQYVTNVALDARRLLTRLDGDVEFLRRIAELYFDVCSTELSRIRESVACRDAETLRAAAHKLRSSVSNLNAQATFEAALKLERIAESGNIAAAPDALATLEKEASRLNTELGRLVDDTPAPSSMLAAD